MKAIRFHEYGDPGVLRYEDAERPEPAEGEMLVWSAPCTPHQPHDALLDRGRYPVLASKAGFDRNPDWYHNLLAHPEARIEVGE